MTDFERREFKTSDEAVATEIAEITDAMLDEILLTLKLERAAVLLEDESGWKIASTHDLPKDGFWTIAPISLSILKDAFDKEQPLMLVDAVGNSNFKDATSVVLSGLRSVICVPIPDSWGRMRGMLYADNRLASGAFSPDDLGTLTELGKELGSRLF